MSDKCATSIHRSVDRDGALLTILGRLHVDGKKRMDSCAEKLKDGEIKALIAHRRSFKM